MQIKKRGAVCGNNPSSFRTWTLVLTKNFPSLNHQSPQRGYFAVNVWSIWSISFTDGCFKIRRVNLILADDFSFSQIDDSLPR